eukprot:scaffold664746_cov39-Prasinocladus_malaysianus.AAC.1
MARQDGSEGGRSGCREASLGLDECGARALIFLPPCHHLLLRIWREKADGGVLVHIATDYWPALFHID